MTEDAGSSHGSVRPLSGRTVIVTRTSRAGGCTLRATRGARGGGAGVSVLEVVDPDDWAPIDAAIGHLSDYDWIVFTSTNAVDASSGASADRGR